MNNHDTPTLTVEQAARHFNCAPTWINRLLVAGRITGTKIDNRWRIDVTSLDDYIAHGRKRRDSKNRGQTKATSIDAPFGDAERGPCQYDGALRLVYAVLACAAEEAVAGDLPAQLWIDSPQSDYWFEVAGIDPDAARAAIKSRSAASHREAAKLDRLIALHNRGATWKAAAMDVFGFYSETLRYRVARHAEALEMAGQAN